MQKTKDGKEQVLYQLDGTSQLSLGLDYFARKYDTLFVLAKGQPTKEDTLKGEIPQDSYDGLVVGGAAAGGGSGLQVVWGQTDFTTGTNDRRLIDLIAPAQGISVPIMGSPTGGYTQPEMSPAGTSLAAPHATGAVALLQQYVAQFAPWAAADKDLAKHHELMKAVLMNSADKVKGVLGSSRDVLHKDGRTGWEKSDARDTPDNPAGRLIPLDAEFGAGALNVGRALKQLQGGRATPYGVNQEPNQAGQLAAPPANPAPTGYINWDYNSIDRKAGDTQPVYNRYLLPPLKKDDWISATLTWDRVVDAKSDKSPLQGFVATPGLADLNLYLMKAGETDVTKNVWSSESSQYNLEDFLVQLPADGQYELWVQQNSKVQTNYALAWWSTEPQPDQPDKQINGHVWYDQDQDNRWGLTEPPVAYDRVELHDAATGALLNTRLTDAAGDYSFPVSAGSYYVTVQRPFGYTFAVPHVGDDLRDSDVDTTGRFDFSLAPADPGIEIDAGLQLQARTASISDVVWMDANADGLRGTDETGLADVSVSLYASDGSLVDSTVTDSTGHYTFSSLPADQYFVQVAQPTNYAFTTPHAGHDELLDSDVNSAGTTDTFVLNDGEQYQDADAGVVLAGASVDGSVWYDADANGLHDLSEDGVSGDTVSLYDANTEALVAQTVTADDGSYEFDSVPAGSYYVAVDSLDGYRFTDKGVGGDATIDSDVNASGLTDAFTLALGDTLHHLDAGLVSLDPPPIAQNDTYSVDFGQTLQVAASGVLANDSDPAGNPLTTTLLIPPANGTVLLAPDGSFSYLPDSGFSGTDGFTYLATDTQGMSSAADVTITVNPPPPASTITLLLSNNYVITYGQSVTLTATVEASSGAFLPATGTISFYDGSTLLGSSPVLMDMATLSTTSLTVGTHSVTAVYSGDSSCQGSTSAALTETVSPVPTSTTLVSSLNPAALGQPVSLTATVTAMGGAGLLGGTITFLDNGVNLATVPVSGLGGTQATFTTSMLSLGTHELSAAYSGDSNYLPSSAFMPLTETITPTSSSPPAVTGLSPNTGPVAGNTLVTIYGSGFTGATQVLFGAVTLTTFTVLSDNSLTVYSPAGSAGWVHVQVVTPAGTSLAGMGDLFTYTQPSTPPVINSISPKFGPTSGGTTVLINGSGFSNATQVSFGATYAASFAINSDTSISAVSPMQGAYTVNIYVWTPSGTSAPSADDQFTYTP